MTPFRRYAPCVVTATLLAALSPPAAALASDDSAALYEQALLSSQQQDFATAEIHLKNALKSDPYFVAGQLLLGKIYLAQGRPALAEKAFVTAKSAGADDALVIEPLADAYLMQRKYRQLLDEIYPQRLSASQTANVLIYRARAYFETSAYDQAELAFADAHLADPGAIAALIGQARVKLARGDIEAATTLADSARLQNPDSGEVWYLIGAIAHAQGALDQALKHYQHAISLQPRHYQARLSRAGVLLDRNRSAEAMEDISQLANSAAYDPQIAYLAATIYRKQGRTANAQQELKRAREIIDALPPKVLNEHGPTLLLAGLIYFDLNETQKALFYLEAFQRQFPGGLPVSKLLAQLYQQTGNRDKAIQALERGLQRTPNDYEQLVQLGRLYQQQGKPAKAAQLFERAIAASDDPQARIGRALSHLALGEQQQGMAQLALAATEGGAQRAGILLALTQIARRDYAAAQASLAQELERNPTNPVLLNLRGSVEVALKDNEAARNSFQQALSSDAGFRPAKINLAKLERISGDLDGAVLKLRQLLEQDPRDTQVMQELARVKQQQGKGSDAIGWLEKASALEPDSLTIQTQLSTLTAANGDPDAALAIAERLNTIYPNDWRATRLLAQMQVASGNPGAATITLKALNRLSGFEPEKLRDTARLQIAAGDHSGAIYSLQKATEEQPQNHPQLFWYASLLIDAGRLDEATAVRDSLAESAPESRELALINGDLALHQGDITGALRHYTALHQHQPSPTTLLRLHRAYLRAGQPRQSIALLEQWVDAQPNDIRARQLLSEGYLHLGETAQARAGFEALLNTPGGRTPSVLNNLATLYINAGHPDALILAREAYQAAPEIPAINDTLGWALVRANQPTDGLKYLRNAYTRAANDPTIAYHLGVALHRLGRFEEAVRELSRALASDVTFSGRAEASQLLAELERR
ncbi:XrtA/PEP-CTERM system TPR-repeat protein PrsT [Motiliproteus sediminis]|uniref:XrtA/PEP-CTERM system TPR-repeat protein PrsT n=1 Tax=Motiliproteus sediminis TaxID=1468178 RepID=UPI001AEF8073|nr:XrtA/PEP-CTERM system TPR-repeat protein PrsT [Motiliproteus sediminis]